MPTSVVIEGDASASGSTTYTGQTTYAGQWNPGEITETFYENLTSDGGRVLYQVSCTFTYRGDDTSTNAPSDAPPTQSTVTLRASTKLLQKGGQFVLVDGDREVDTHGNEVSVSGNNTLKTD